MTAISNDYGYEHVFVRQIEALGAAGDVAFGISTSGRSRNVEAALATAKARGLVTIGLTGRDGGRMGTILHEMCSLIDQQLRSGVDAG